MSLHVPMSHATQWCVLDHLVTCDSHHRDSVRATEGGVPDGPSRCSVSDLPY